MYYNTESGFVKPFFALREAFSPGGDLPRAVSLSDRTDRKRGPERTLPLRSPTWPQVSPKRVRCLLLRQLQDLPVQIKGDDVVLDGAFQLVALGLDRDLFAIDLPGAVFAFAVRNEGRLAAGLELKLDELLRFLQADLQQISVFLNGPGIDLARQVGAFILAAAAAAASAGRENAQQKKGCQKDSQGLFRGVSPFSVSFF